MTREVLLDQQSRVKWSIEGEQNTKCFHTTVIIRRRKNTIGRLKNNEGTWTEDQEELKNLAREFYVELYKVEPSEPIDPTLL